MKPSLTLIIFLILSSHAFGVVNLTRVPAPSFTTTPAITPVVRSTEILHQAPQIDLSSLSMFQGSHYFDTCEVVGTNLPTNFMNLIDALYTRCESKVERAMQQPTHAGKLNILATEACPCFREDTTLYSLVSPPASRGGRSAPQSRRGGILGFGSKDPPPDEEQIISSVDRANIHLAELRNGIMFQASILSADPQIMQGLATVYSNGFYQNATTAFADANRRLQEEFRRPEERRQATLDATLQIPQYNPGILTGAAPPPSCVSMRDYRAYRQFPEDPEFYQDLLSSRHNEFHGREWSFPRLKQNLSDLCRDNHILTLDEAKRDPRTGWMVRRLDFLNRNPLLKNLLSGTGRQGKEELFNLVMDTFKPADASCAQGTGSVAHACQLQAVRKAQTFRDGLLGIFRRPDVASSVARESQQELDANLKTLPEIVTRAHHIPTAQELSVFDPASYRRIQGMRGSNHEEHDHAPGGEEEERTEGDRLLRLRVSSMNQMCPTIETTNSLNGNYVVNELEGQWANEIADPVWNVGEQSFNNPGFQEFSSNICNRGSGDDRISFDQFKRDNCSAPNSCPNPMAEYIRRYPSGAEIDQAKVFAEFSVRAPVTNLGQTAVASVASTSGRSYSDHVRSINTNLESTFSGSGEFREARLLPPPPVSQSGSQSQTASQQNPQQQQPVLPFLPEQLTVPQTPQETAARTEVLRSQVRESDLESRGIRDEIGSLRDVIRERNESGGTGDGRSLQDLNARLADLDRRLMDSERRKSSAENELRRITSRNEELERVNGRPTQVAASEISPRTSPTAGQTTGGAARVAPSAAQSGASSGAQSGSLSGSSPGAGRIGGVSRVQASQSNTALLAKYGVQSYSEQGSLIVADASSSVDFQRLRLDSEQSTLPISLSVEEYNLIAGNNREALRPYVDQCRAMVGDVCRLSISAQGTDSALELFVLKSGNEVSIVQTPGAGRSLASRSLPVPEPVRTRDATLDRLKAELGQ